MTEQVEATTVSRTNVRWPRCLATLRLIDVLKEGKVDTTFSDEELTVTCARDTRPTNPETGRPGNGYGYLSSAIRHVLAEYGLVYQRVHKAGCIKCIGAEEVLGIADAARKSTHKREKRTVRKMTAVYADASDQERTMLNQKLAVHGALVEFASARLTKRLVASNKTVAVPSMAKLLEALQES